MRPDLVVEARAFLRGAFSDVEIGIDEEAGTILAVKKVLVGQPRVRLHGLLVPSGVDLHVHFRDPGHPQKEDFGTGSRAAAMGGIGTVLDMPNTVPVVDRPSRLEDKREAVAPKACVDWGLWCTLTPETTKPAQLLRAAAGLKLYLAPTTGIPDPGSRQDLRFRLAAAHQAGRVVAVHAEEVDATPPRSLQEHEGRRPSAGEVATIADVSAAAPEGGLIHITHCSTAEAVQAARAARFSVGTTPHHLLLAYNEGDLGTWGKVNPPLRSAERRAALWRAFERGDVPILESDHAPHTMDEKRRPFPEAPAGVPGVETGYPLLLYEAKRRALDPAHVIRAYSENPAARLGIRKGRIEPGYDADFFVFDPGATGRIRAAELQSRCGWSPFEGRESYRVQTHYLRGRVVVDGGQFVGRRGSGRPVTPAVTAPVRNRP